MENMIQDIAKNFDKLSFNEERHEYAVDGQKRKGSVSSKVDHFVEEVDFKVIAQRIAQRDGIPVGQILQEWDDEKEVCIFDEMRWDSIEYTTLLAILTFNGGMKLKIKGGFCWFHPKIIVITSPESAESEFSRRDKDDIKTLRSDFA